MSLLAQQQAQFEKIQAYNFEQFKQMQKMLIQMQKSQQWSFEHLQKQIDDMPDRLAAAAHTGSNALTQAKQLQDLSLKSNASLANLNCTNLVTCDNGENCAEVSMCRLNDTCSLVQKCRDGNCEQKEMCSASKVQKP